MFLMARREQASAIPVDLMQNREQLLGPMAAALFKFARLWRHGLAEVAGPYLSYLRALEAWDRRFPGFAHDTQGVEVVEGTYCLTGLPLGSTRGFPDVRLI